MLTQTAKYALQALIYLCNQEDDDYHQTKEVARIIRVPANYLGKTLQKLARAKIVDSQKGLHGGFRIAKLAEQVRLYDIFVAIEAIPVDFAAEHDHDDRSELGRLYERMDGMDRLYAKFLKETTLADVLQQPARAQRSAQAVDGGRGIFATGVSSQHN